MTENYFGDADIEFLQRKISAAGGMKTAIKRFLDVEDNPSMQLLPVTMNPIRNKRIKELRKAMEDYLNVT